MTETLPTDVLNFFNANPDATECFVALGYVLATREAAEKKLAGVKGHMPMRYERGEGVKHEKDSDALLEIVIQFEAEEQAAHEAFDLNATDDNMNAWKDAQKNLDKAKQEYDRIVAEEKKLEEKETPVININTAKEETPEMLDHVVTEEDLVNNPELAENGVKVGDTIQLPAPEKTEE